MGRLGLKFPFLTPLGSDSYLESHSKLQKRRWWRDSEKQKLGHWWNKSQGNDRAFSFIVVWFLSMIREWSWKKGIFINMEKRFLRDTELHNEYSNGKQKYILLSHLDLVTNSKDFWPDLGYYLPHHCVIKETSSCVRLWIIFNGSLRTEMGLSLNALLHAGPKLQTKLSDDILCFKMYPVVFTAEIEKIFRCIWVHTEDQDFDQILWRGKLKPIPHATSIFRRWRCQRPFNLGNPQGRIRAKEVAHESGRGTPGWT